MTWTSRSRIAEVRWPAVSLEAALRPPKKGRRLNPSTNTARALVAIDDGCTTPHGIVGATGLSAEDVRHALDGLRKTGRLDGMTITDKGRRDLAEMRGA